MDQNTVGDRIRELRKSKNLTQDDLAGLMNTSRVQINQWETGARELSASRIVDFASALETSCEFLLRGVPVEKADSYNQTGLDLSSLSAFSDLMELPEHKKKQYLSVLNGVLGSDYFWRTVMPHILSALTIQENAVMGGAFSGFKDFTPEILGDKLKDSVQTLSFSNAAGYMDHILISQETAVSFQLQEAADAFKPLLKAVIDKLTVQKDNDLFTAPYRPNKTPDDQIDLVRFSEYLRAMGLNVDYRITERNA